MGSMSAARGGGVVQGKTFYAGDSVTTPKAMAKDLQLELDFKR